MIEIERRGWHPNHMPIAATGAPADGCVFYVDGSSGPVPGGRMIESDRAFVQGHIARRIIATDARAIAIAARVGSRLVILSRSEDFPIARVFEAYGLEIESDKGKAAEPATEQADETPTRPRKGKG